MAEFYYQMVEVPNRARPVGGPSAAGQATAAGVKLLHKASQALNGWAVSHRVNQELKQLSPTIENLMPRGGGVLVCVGLQEWARPDATGTRAQMFLSIHIAGAGTDPNKVLQSYLAQPRLVQGAASGWSRKDVFLWVTSA